MSAVSAWGVTKKGYTVSATFNMPRDRNELWRQTQAHTLHIRLPTLPVSIRVLKSVGRELCFPTAFTRDVR